MSFKYDQFLSQEQADRLDRLLLSIEPSPEQQQEIRQLQQYAKKHLVAFDADNDPDPDSIAARQSQIARDLFREANEYNERQAARAERYYAQQFKKLNSFGLRS